MDDFLNGKILLRKQLKTTRLIYEEMQTVLSEVEMIDNIKSFLTPNQLLIGRNID